MRSIVNKEKPCKNNIETLPKKLLRNQKFENEPKS
jgi:hypothetical protein